MVTEEIGIPLFLVVGARGFEPPTPCSQSRNLYAEIPSF